MYVYNEKQDELRDKIAGAIYGMAISDLFTDIDRDTMKPVFKSEYSDDVRVSLEVMGRIADGSKSRDEIFFQYDNFIYHSVIVLLPFALVERDKFVSEMLGRESGRFFPQPYLAASQAIYDTIYRNQGSSSWIRLNKPYNVSESLRTLCEQWNTAISLAGEAYAFPDAVVMANSNGTNCDPATVGMLAGARFGLHSISGKWIVEVPVETRRIVGKFANACIKFAK